VPESADYVMYWWHRAAELTRAGRLRRFGLITTNSLRQTFNRRVMQQHLNPPACESGTRDGGGTTDPALSPARGGRTREVGGRANDLSRFSAAGTAVRGESETPLSLVFAIPDHPWVDSADGAAVRIAMSCGVAGSAPGFLATVVAESPGQDEGVEVGLQLRPGKLNADLSVGADVAGAVALRANSGVSARGMIPHGAGFFVTADEARALGLGRVPGLDRHIRRYRNGRDLTQIPREVLAVDLYGLTLTDVRARFPEVYQWLLERVKPERDHNTRASRRDNWWLFGESQPALRGALVGLSRYIATVQTSKHRFFVFLDAAVLPDDKLIAVALDDAYSLGVLSSRVHVTWALAAGATLEDRPVYNKTACFDAFPFPALTPDPSLASGRGESSAAQVPAGGSSESSAVLAAAGGRVGGPAGDPSGRRALAPMAAPREGIAARAPLPQAPVPQAPPLAPGAAREAPDPVLALRIRELAEQIDAHRKRQQALYPGLTLTGMYNVLEKLGTAEPLTEKERAVHEQGLVSVLRELHDALDAAVLAAYGWSDLAPALVGRPGGTTPTEAKAPEQAEAEEELLLRLVALNAERAAEERRGLVRWLRPDYEVRARGAAQTEAETEAAGATSVPTVTAARRPWPKTLAEQAQAVRAVLAGGVPVTVEELAGTFQRAPRGRVADLLETLVSLGQAQRLDDGRYAGA